MNMFFTVVGVVTVTNFIMKFIIEVLDKQH